LSEAALPSRSIRKTLPPSESSFWGVVPMAASPVPTHKKPSGPKRGRHPLCRPVLYGIPVTMSRRSTIASPLGVRSVSRTNRTSFAPPAFEVVQTYT
jgi:hypothetical protein